MKQDSDLRNGLKSIITHLGTSQQDLADLACVIRQAISGVESGKCAPSVAMTTCLAKTLGCQVEDVLGNLLYIQWYLRCSLKPRADIA